VTFEQEVQVAIVGEDRPWIDGWREGNRWLEGGLLRWAWGSAASRRGKRYWVEGSLEGPGGVRGALASRRRINLPPPTTCHPQASRSTVSRGFNSRKRDRC